MMSNSNKISIPKEIFENIFFANGGEKRDIFKALTGEYQFALDSKKPMVEPNAEIEGGEYIFDSQGIRKAKGKTHEKGGMPVALEDGTRILSDHLKIGVDAAKRINKELGLPAKATDTYAKILDKFNTKTGLDKINSKLESLMGMMKDQKTKVKDKQTSSLNIDFLSKQLYKENQSKKPIEKQREKLFDIIFELQEESKRKASMPDYKMEMGGMIGSTANKYGISQDRAKELLNLPKYQKAGTALSEDTKAKLEAYKELYNKNKELIVNSSGRQDFTKIPRTVNTLPYTPRDVSTNVIWQGENYSKAWQPLVRTSMSDPDKAAKIDKWLTENKDKYSANIQAQLKGLTGEARMKRIEQLATDQKPGPFHNALLQAMVAVNEEEPPKEVPTEEKKTEEPLDVSKNTNYAMLNLPQRIYQAPTLQPSIKQGIRLDDIQAAYVSPTQKIMETDRAVQAAQQNLVGMSDSQRAAATIGLTANQAQATGNAITETNRANIQAQNAADIYNNKIRGTEKEANNKYAKAYQVETQTGLSNYENDWQNLRNLRFEDQLNNYKTVEMMNAQNANNPQVQYRGTGLGYETNYKPDLGKVAKPLIDNLTKPFSLADVSNDILRQEFINRTAKEEADKEAEAKKIQVSKFGGRFKKK